MSLGTWFSPITFVYFYLYHHKALKSHLFNSKCSMYFRTERYKARNCRIHRFWLNRHLSTHFCNLILMDIEIELISSYSWILWNLSKNKVKNITYTTIIYKSNQKGKLLKRWHFNFLLIASVLDLHIIRLPPTQSILRQYKQSLNFLI